MSVVNKDDSIEIRDVWSDNLDQEFDLINEAIDKFPYVAMDTEFPGIVWKPKTASTGHNHDLTYESIKKNVNILKLIQLGLTLSDEQGNLPTCGTNNKQCLWQFNFREFDPRSDLYAVDSIELLRKSGIDFAKFNERGIEANRFAELLQGSGVVSNDKVQWVTFQCGSDFGYLLRLHKGEDLPEKRSEFLDLVKIFFPRVYDVKYMVESGYIHGLHGGLSSIADALGVERLGVSHQAGSDSLLTMRVFMEMKKRYSMDRFSGFLFGLGRVN